jgi:hypothetical protein
MNRSMRISLAVVAVLLMSVMPGQADRGGGHGGGHGGGWGWGPVLGLGLGLGLWEMSRPYYGYPYYPYNAPIVQQQPTEIYVQPAPQLPVEAHYWYYCRNPEGYYPYVKQCPEGWMRVVPSAPQP